MGNPKEGVANPLVSPAILLHAVALVVGETAGLDPEQRAQLTGRVRPALDPTNPQRRALDAWVETSPVAQYVALMIDCEQTRLRDAVSAPAILARYESLPLVRFRLSVCGSPGAPAPATIRAANSRFLDTLPWEARRAMIGSPTEPIDLYKAAELIGEAHASVVSQKFVRKIG